VSLIKSEVSLDHDGLILSSPSYVQRIVGKDSLLHFDYPNNTFTLFNLNSRKPIWHLGLQIEGPDFLDKPVLDFGMRHGSIVILSQNYISLFDQSGKVINRVGADEIPNFRSSFSLGSLMLNETDNITISKRLYSIIFPKRPYDPDESLFIGFENNTLKLKELSAEIPVETLVNDPSKGFYQQGTLQSVKLGSKIIYNFRFNSKIYILNTLTGVTTTLEAASVFTENTKQSIPQEHSMEEALRLQSLGPTFLQTHYDTKTKNFIRVHLAPILDANQEITAYDYYLMVFDESLKVLKEFKLDDEVVASAFVNDGKVYVKKRRQLIENEFAYFVYELKID